jgi:hypothetical protein
MEVKKENNNNNEDSFQRHATQISDELFVGDATSASLFGFEELQKRGFSIEPIEKK